MKPEGTGSIKPAKRQALVQSCFWLAVNSDHYFSYQINSWNYLVRNKPLAETCGLELSVYLHDAQRMGMSTHLIEDRCSDW